jgi:ribonuclease J
VLPALNFPPLYATKLTIGLIKKQLEEHKILDKATLIEVDAGSEKEIHVGPFKVEYFKVNHSIPDCAGLYITSPS